MLALKLSFPGPRSPGVISYLDSRTNAITVNVHRKTERQKDRKTERQKDRKAERQKGPCSLTPECAASWLSTWPLEILG